MNVISIRREDLSKKGERRVAVVPELAEKIVAGGSKLLVQPGIHPDTEETKRAFKDVYYEKAGALIVEDISEADVIFGLKEVGKKHIIPEKAYLMFSHTHKGQVKNRPMLKALVEKKATLIDYELIVGDDRQRIVTAFTYFAGYAGMIDSLWTLGQRLSRKGIMNPFYRIPQAVEKEDLDVIKGLITAVGEYITDHGTPAEIPPIITCFLGNGKTSTGAQEIYDLMPVKSITMDELADVYANGSRNVVYKLVLDIPEMYRFKPGLEDKGKGLSFSEVFSLYIKEPEHFESNIDQIIPYCSMMMNCIIWSSKYPRLITRKDMKTWYAEHKTLEVIGDITCDPEGAIQFSKETWIDDPVFIYHPEKESNTLGMDGEGIAVMAVTNLPCEFSADASALFSENLSPLIEGIVKADYDADDISTSGLPEPILGATILWKGKFTEKYAYMAAYL